MVGDAENRHTPVRRYVWILAGLAAATTIAAVAMLGRSLPTSTEFAYALVLAVSFFVAQRAAVAFPWRGQRVLVALDEAVIFIGLLTLPPALAVLGAAAGAAIAQGVARRDAMKVAFNVSNIALSVTVAAAVMAALNGRSLGSVSDAIVATGCFALTSNILLSGIFAAIDGVGIFDVFRKRFLHLALAHAGLGISAGLVVLALWSLSPVAVVALVPFAYFARSYVTLSATADREILAHRELAEISFDLVGAANLDTLADRVLEACGNLFRAGSARLELEFKDGERRVWSREFEGGVSHISRALGTEIPSRGRVGGRITVYPSRKSYEAFTEADAELLRIVAGQAAALANNAFAIGELNQLAHRMELILTSAGEGILSVDAKGRTILVNHAALALLGWNPKDAHEHTDHEVFMTSLASMTSHRGAKPCPICATLVDGSVRRGADVARRGRTDLLSVEYVIAPIQEAGEIVGAVMVLADVSARKKAEEAQRMTVSQQIEIDRLKEANRVRSQFLSNASHELNTPLTPIRMQLELLKGQHLGALTPEQERSIAVLDRNIQRLGLLVQDVLDVGRLQSGRLRIAPHPIDLARTLTEAHETFRASAEKRGVQLALVSTGELNVNADPDRMSQVLYNFVSNAIKFTPDGGTIAVEGARVDDKVVVRVRDSGAGVTPDQAVHLFEPFSQVHDTTKMPGGTGLGLFISKGIIEQQGGEVGVESGGPGHGSTFWFKLPLLAGGSPPGEKREATSRETDRFSH
ncbi:MAG: sensor histidine kinase [Thermoplasmatota archaeon]